MSNKILSKDKAEKIIQCEGCGARKFYLDKEKNVYRCMYCDCEYPAEEETEEIEEIEVKAEKPGMRIEDDCSVIESRIRNYLDSFGANIYCVVSNDVVRRNACDFRNI